MRRSKTPRQPSRPEERAGAAVAIVAASSAFGIGATAAVADTPADTGVVQPGGATTVTTSATADETVTDGSPAPVPTSTPATETPVASPAATPAPSSPPTPTPTPPAKAAPAGAPAAEPDASLAFPEGTSADAPFVLTATAGDALARTSTASGGAEPVTYALRGEQGKPVVGDGSIDNDFHLDGTTGVLSGTARLATQYRFQVVASSGARCGLAPCFPSAPCRRPPPAARVRGSRPHPQPRSHFPHGSPARARIPVRSENA